MKNAWSGSAWDRAELARRIAGAREVALAIPAGLEPTRVRLCWADSPVCTLYDRAGLPAGPFELAIE